jgi:hypothetical protein
MFRGIAKMLESTEYVPVLRWKRAEWTALRFLSEDVKARVLPLIEVPPSRLVRKKGETFVNMDECIAEIVKEVERSWGGRRFFLDMSLLDSPGGGRGLSAEALAMASKQCESRSLNGIPVSGLGRDRTYQGVVRKWAAKCGGACLRVNAEGIGSGTALAEVYGFANSVGLRKEDVHLVVDFGYLNAAISSYGQIWERIPDAESWANVVICGGSFPVNLMGFVIGIQEVPRREWLAWRGQIPAAGWPRSPIYGDYTIQHPVFVEPPGKSNPSASIRYALEESWLIFRGEGLRTSELGNAQYAGHAILLRDREEYYGESFSYGDKYIWGVAEGGVNPGNPESWLRAGVNHHITVVVRQIERLAG